MLELEQFTELESKIQQLVELVKTLKNDNKNLRLKIDELQKNLSVEKSKHNDTNSYLEREDVIRNKIEQILTKLEFLDNPL
jgi:uncharacterized coiled-coil DUF342 family protein